MTSRRQANRTWEELEAARQQLASVILPDIKKTKEELDSYRADLLVGTSESPAIKEKISQTQEKITKSFEQAQQYVGQILSLHKSVFGDSATTQNTLKEKLEGFLEDAEELLDETDDKKEKFDEFYDKVFGVKDASGKIQGGLESELEKYSGKYQLLFDQIENLLPGATSAGLAGVFGDKVVEYKAAEQMWARSFLGLSAALTIYFAFFILNTPESSSLVQASLALLHKVPFLIFAVWFLVFIGNRRAENKKLEEAYKHKEVMARSYVGYKEHILEIEEDDDDKILLKAHMDNLLNAINENSSRFLSDDEKHPIMDTFSKWLSNGASKKDEK